MITANAHGPGGGGGGGAIYSNVNLLGSVTAAGGVAGLFLDSDFTPPLSSGTHGADAGGPGKVASVTDFPFPVGCDFPDEPGNLNYNGDSAFHLVTATGGSITPLHMGGFVDFEPAFTPSALADADDLNQTSATRQADDEDGVNFRYPDTGGLEADVLVFNPFLANIKVCAWLDYKPQNGMYDGAAEGYCQDTAQGAPTLTFAWPDLVGDITTYARFRISSRPLFQAFPNLPASDGEIESHLVVFPPPEDYGDASVSFGDAWHYTVKPIYLGAVPPDAEPATVSPSVNADGDDLDQVPDDEDGLDINSLAAAPDMYATAEVSLSNGLTRTSDAAQLVGWVDFDGDGIFDNDCGGAPVGPNVAGVYTYPNYCERSLPQLFGLSGDPITEVVDGYADSADHLGVVEPDRALGYPEGSVAELAGAGTVWLTLDLTDVVDEGETLTIWANGPDQVILPPGPGVASLEVSPDDITYTPMGTLTRDGNAVQSTHHTVPLGSGGARYVRVTLQSEDIGIDAVGYAYTRIEPCDLDATYGGADARDLTFTTGNIPAACSNATAKLMWTNINAGSGPVPSGPAHVRVRLTTDSDFFGDLAPAPVPTALAVDGEVEDYLVNITPTAVTLGEFNLENVRVAEFLAQYQGDGSQGLLTLLASWDTRAAASLAGATREAIESALQAYLDPDGDGGVVVVQWQTLEQHGTLGFYIERRAMGGEWIRVNQRMLPSLLVAPMGAEYQLLDPQAPAGAGLEYRLVEQEAWGTTRTYGPFPLN